MRTIIDTNPKKKIRSKILIGVATEGWIRFEWANARYSQIIPINWEMAGFDLNYTALGFNIDDAYNLITKQTLEMGVEWLVTIEDDVLVPPDLFMKLSKYIQNETIPIVSGLYFSKGNPSEPLVFRGRGNGCYYKWRMGDKVWCDALPMGCLLIHNSILNYMWNNSEEYIVPNGEKVKRVFVTPRKISFHFAPFHYHAQQGTQDMYFFDRLLNEKVLKKTGWHKMARKKYPFLCDTNIFCKHIDRATGKQYPC